jgi:zinc protease
MNYQTPFSTKLITALTLLVFAGLFVSTVFTQSAPREQRLLNGLKLLMFDASGSDKVTLRVRIHAGSAFDPQGKEGVMRLLANNIFPNPEMKEYFSEQLGGSLDIGSTYDYIQVTASSKPESLLTMLEAVATAVVSGPIDKETTAKLRAAQLERLRGLEKDPSYLADQAAAARLLGTFPYGRPAEGTTLSVEKIDFADLLAAKERFFTADNATVTLSGKFDQALAYRAVRRFFGAWLKSDKLVPSTFRQPDNPPTGVLRIDSPMAERIEFRFATRGTSSEAVDAVSYRIAARVLERRLKAFSADLAVSARSDEHVLPGTLLIAASVPAGASATKFDFESVVLKTLSTPVSDEEFQPAKQAVLSELDQADIADRWLDVDTFKTEIPAKYRSKASATTLIDVQTVLSRLQKQSYATVMVGSAKSS